MKQAVVEPIRASSAAPILQRKCGCGTHTQGGSCAECGKKRLQRKARGSADDFEIPPIVDSVLAQPGRSLDRGTRTFMEERFGRDFSGVRVHTDGVAARSARAVDALAYTVGRHIVFGEAQYAPSTADGRRLLAHELAHTVQQGANGGAPSRRPASGTVDTSAEREADRAAERVVAGGAVPRLTPASEPALRRQPAPSSDASEPNFDSPQRRGGRPRSTIFDVGRRGLDTVRVAVTRYLCECIGRNVTKGATSTRMHPTPGVTLEICNGRVTARLEGDVVPSLTGRVTARGEVNVSGATRVGVEGEVRNNRGEPEIVGRGDIRVRTPGGTQIGGEVEVSRGTQTGNVSVGSRVGVDVGGGVGPVVTGTDLNDPNRRTVTIGVGTTPGRRVQDQVCRECRCPVAYECFEDIPPRDYKEPVVYDVETRERLRYYFKLDTADDTPDRALQAESQRMLDEVARRVGEGARIVSVTGYASPEDNRERPTPNQELSLSRARRLHGLLASRLGAQASLPAPSAGGELLGRTALSAPDSRLADAMVGVGFGDAEDVTLFLFGEDIANPQLAQQFLQLFEQRLTQPADRLRLFGIDSASPLAPRLLASIEQFVRNRGRGRRPWEGIFGHLRFATVELSRTTQVPGQVDRRTSGSIRALPDAQCPPYARYAESQGLFGPAEPEPLSETGCPSGEARNLPRFANKCDYSRR